MEPALFVIAVIASQGSVEAGEQATRAYFQHYKIDEALDRYQRKIISDQQRFWIEQTAIIAKVSIERQVTFKWSY